MTYGRKGLGRTIWNSATWMTEYQRLYPVAASIRHRRPERESEVPDRPDGAPIPAAE